MTPQNAAYLSMDLPERNAAEDITDAQAILYGYGDTFLSFPGGACIASFSVIRLGNLCFAPWRILLAAATVQQQEARRRP